MDKVPNKSLPITVKPPNAYWIKINAFTSY